MAEKQLHPVPVPKIAACLIVKDATQTVAAAVGSIRPYVDGIFVYDTGSSDGTPEMLEAMNAKEWLYFTPDGRAHDEMPEAVDGVEAQAVPLAPIVVQRGEWRDDFAWAREQSFAMVPDEFDWFFWLDDDDEVIGADALRDLAYRSTPELDGFVFRYDYAHDPDGNCVCTLWRERLLRRSVGWRWEGAVHEVAIPDGRPPRYANVPADTVRYVHKRPAGRYPDDRNLQILEARERRAHEAGEDVDARTLAYLGTENLAQGRPAQAVPYFERYLALPMPPNDERSQVWHKMAWALRLLGQVPASTHAEFQAIQERDDWVENYAGLAESHAMAGEWTKVARWAKQAIELPENQTFLIINPLEVRLLPMLRLAEALTQLGRGAEADEWLARARAFAPGRLVEERAAVVGQTRLEVETVQAILALREVLVRHDENKKAYEVLEAAPYFVAEHPVIVKARADQREMVRHMTHPDEYVRWYRDEPKESTFPWSEIDRVGELFERARLLMEGVKEQEAELGRPPRILDCGCNDWWIGAWFHRNGYEMDGVELNGNSYRNALELRAQEGAWDVTLVQGDLHDAAGLLAAEGHVEGYDAVSLFEVLEHVPDIGRTLDVLESLVKPGGRVYISTPNGAFERGNLPNWARVERKGHLRATPIHELAEILLARGDVEMLGETDGGRLTFACYTPRPRKASVTFYAGGGWEPWSPQSINTTGLGGSETALVQVATRLASRGHVVKVYSGAEPGLMGGVLYRPHTAWDPTEDVDLLVVSRMPHVADNPLGAKRTALWCHDMDYGDQLTPERAEKFGRIVVLSEWQRERFARLYPFAEDRLTVIRNGIGLLDTVTGEDDRYEYQRPFEERLPKAVYSSSADRGLDTLLEVWPAIRERVPDAELHVFYGWDVFDRVAMVRPDLREYKAKVLALADAAGGEGGGVFMRGRIGQRALAQEMSTSRVLAYPTDFLETSCITAMEARACGVPIVTSDLGALAETAAGGLLIAAEEGAATNQTEAYRAEFVAAVAELLSDEDRWTAESEDVLIGRPCLDWSYRILEWERVA